VTPIVEFLPSCSRQEAFKDREKKSMSMIRGLRTIFTPGTSGVPVAQQPPNPAPPMPNNTFAYLQRMGPPQVPQPRPQVDNNKMSKPRPAQVDPNAEQKPSKGEGRVSKKSDRRGRPKKISDDLTQKMIRLLENSNDDVSLEELGHAVGVDGVHLQTIRNYMIKEGYCKRIACQQKWLTNHAREMRMQYALAHQRWQNEWRSVLFSDCVNFGLGTTRKAKVFNRKDERLCEECLQSREGIDKSIFYCWAMVGYDYKSPLVFLSTEDADHPVLSQHDYISQILQPNVQPIVSVKRFVYLDTGSTGQAPGQNMVHAYLESVHIPYLRNPEASPDLNVFKDVMLILKKRLQKRSIGDKIQLKIAVLEEWDKITTKEINKLVDSMNPRMEKLLARKGMPL
jgi:hypothetical protein